MYTKVSPNSDSAASSQVERVLRATEQHRRQFLASSGKVVAALGLAPNNLLTGGVQSVLKAKKVRDAFFDSANALKWMFHDSASLAHGVKALVEKGVDSLDDETIETLLVSVSGHHDEFLANILAIRSSEEAQAAIKSGAMNDFFAHCDEQLDLAKRDLSPTIFNYGEGSKVHSHLDGWVDLKRSEIELLANIRQLVDPGQSLPSWVSSKPEMLGTVVSKIQKIFDFKLGAGANKKTLTQRNEASPEPTQQSTAKLDSRKIEAKREEQRGLHKNNSVDDNGFNRWGLDWMSNIPNIDKIGLHSEPNKTKQQLEESQPV